MNESPRTTAGPQEVLAFWRASGPDKWFTKDVGFDDEIRRRFLATYEAAAAGALAWNDTADGAFALLIVLDQFPRNMFRGSARAFAADPLAREVATRAIARGFDQQVAVPERSFFYLPFEHSETLADQERCVALNRQAATPMRSNGPSCMPTSSAASAAFPTAMRCSAAPPRPRSRHSWMTAAFRVEGITETICSPCSAQPRLNAHLLRLAC